MAAAVHDTQNLFCALGQKPALKFWASSYCPFSGAQAWHRVQAPLGLETLRLSSAFLGHILHIQQGHQPANDGILMIIP